MPVRPRIQALREVRVDPRRAFTESVGGLGLDDGWFNDLPCFASMAQSRAAWPKVRRLVWGGSVRNRIPTAATEYDGITLESLDRLLFIWNHIAFDLTSVLAALATDHANLLTFERTPGAKDIEDYLRVFRADLQEIETTARALADFDGPYWLRPYPQHLFGRSDTYSQAVESQR